VPGTPQHGKSILAFVLMTTAYSVLLCWIYLHTAGSVLIATLVHGAINLFQGIFLGGVDPAMHHWLQAGVYWAAALVIVLIFGPGLSRRQLVLVVRSRERKRCDEITAEPRRHLSPAVQRAKI
jgi:uncharacterized protein